MKKMIVELTCFSVFVIMFMLLCAWGYNNVVPAYQ